MSYFIVLLIFCTDVKYVLTLDFGKKQLFLVLDGQIRKYFVVAAERSNTYIHA
jgi:hypothetical protein